MHTKRMIGIMVVLAMILASLSGCGAKSEAMDNGAVVDRYYDGLYDSVGETSAVAPEAKPVSTGSTGGTVAAQKLVRTMNIEAETDDLDAFLTEMKSKMQSLGGYMENQSLRNGGSTATRRYRHANMTIRIPADRLGEFVDHVSGASNVIYYNENADDITLRYVATQSRVTALETEQQRLLELLAKAENMGDLLQIEERLTAVRTELEQVTSQMRLFDNMVDYGTVQLTITEVQEYTVVEEQTVWQKIGSGLSENWKGLCSGAEWLFVFFITSLPYLIPIGAIITCVIVAAKRAKKKSEKKEPPKAEEEK